MNLKNPAGLSSGASAVVPVHVYTVFVIMLLLYFIIGLFTVINQQFQVPLQAAMLPHDGNITNALVTLLNFSWFLAYPLSEGFGTRWLQRYGYRKTSVYALSILVAGLGIYELAVLFHIYMPASVLILGNRISAGFFIFLAGSFVIGISMTVLQVVLNLYLAVSQVGKTTELQRQMIGGTTNSVGMAIAPLFVSYLIFGGAALSKIRTQQFILPLILLMAAMAAAAFFTGRIRMPAVPAAAVVADKTETVLKKNIWSFPHLRLGVLGLFFYVGIEVAVGANINMYAVELGGKYAPNASHMAALYWGLLLLGRLAASFIRSIPSQTQLIYTSIGAAILLTLAMIFADPWILAGTGLFHSVMWPAIFTLAIDKLGPYTSKGSGVLMIGVIGGGIIPLLQGIFADVLGGAWRWTWILVILGEAYILFYGLRGYRVKKTADD